MKKKLLYEISIIRPLIIFLLVVYHSLCVFTGGWVPPAGVPDNAVYWWLGHLISGFRIETIAFVGGYVFCYQCVEQARRQRFFAFVWKKFKRLIIPCFLFGIVYFLLYRFNPARFSFHVAFWRVANGIGHLWFLPMLFWCFMASWLLDRLLHWLSERHPAFYRPAGWLLLLLLAGVSLLRPTGLKLGLTRAPYFLFYFYLGYWLRALIRQRLEAPQTAEGSPWRRVVCLCLAWMTYLAVLLLYLQVTNLHLPGVSFQCPHWLRGWNIWCVRLLTFGRTTSGILALYFTVICFLRHHRSPDAQPSPFLRQCSRLCYGVYVFHMFFMQHLYFGTSFPQLCCASTIGAWLLPWVVLVITLSLSVVLTSLLLRTRFGRFLIG